MNSSSDFPCGGPDAASPDDAVDIGEGSGTCPGLDAAILEQRYRDELRAIRDTRIGSIRHST
jgi:hypothetical protein